jgi:hypothetical protein
MFPFKQNKNKTSMMHEHDASPKQNKQNSEISVKEIITFSCQKRFRRYFAEKSKQNFRG